jgi:hypothetical protein
MENLSDIKDYLIIAKPIIDPIITAIVKPLIEKAGTFSGAKTDDASQATELQFAEYLTRTHFNADNINVLIFPNQQIKINDLYLPLTLASTKDQKRYKIEDFQSSFIDEFEMILIQDTAGMGKSTISKFITLKILENQIAIPVLIDLRNLKANHDILSEICRQFNSVGSEFDRDVILNYLNTGEFIIILDGFDEIHLKSKEVIIASIRDFINKTRRNKFILTSRPEGALATFGDFQSFSITPLEEEEAYSLIKKYDKICPRPVADKLIKDIKSNFGHTMELLRNPFLVSLIYSTYTYNNDIPSGKAIFYEEIYVALFKRHDLSKDGWKRPKNSNLDIHQFKIVLRQFAFDTAKVGSITYSEGEMLDLIDKAKNKCPGIEFKTEDFLDDILSAVPLFLQDGPKIKWAHKSLQDYFCADFIAFSEQKMDIINRIYKAERYSYLNTLDLFYEIDYKTFRFTILETLLEQFIDHYEQRFNNLTGADQATLDLIKLHTFGTRVFIYKTSKETPFRDFNSKFLQFAGLVDESYSRFTLHVDQLWVVMVESFNSKLLELLSSKQANFLSPAKANDKAGRLQIKNDQFIELLDDATSPLNTKKNSKAIIPFLAHSTRVSSNSLVFDYKKALEELKMIKSEKRKQAKADYLEDI